MIRYVAAVAAMMIAVLPAVADPVQSNKPGRSRVPLSKKGKMAKKETWQNLKCPHRKPLSTGSSSI